MTKAITATVVGRVQGVGFRYYTRQIGRRLGLAGWVRNLADGSVEVWAQGEESAIAEFEDFLRRGPGAAVVRYLTVTEVEHEPAYESFDITF
jgi:acylphosphatase